jgi:hypothetical protein
MRVVKCLRRQRRWQAYLKSPSLTAIGAITGLLGGHPARIRAAGSFR